MPPTIGWDENSPPDTESAGLGDDRIRSLKSSIRVGLAGEHVWPAGGGEAGVHLLGSGRPFYGAQSAVSSTGTDGRLMQTSDTSRLFGVGSGGTVLYGGATALLAGAFPGTVPQRHHWAIEMGTVTTLSGISVVTIPRSGYSGIPYVMATWADLTGGAALARIVTVNGKSPTQFQINTFDDAGAALSGQPVDWVSIGSRVL